MSSFGNLMALAAALVGVAACSRTSSPPGASFDDVTANSGVDFVDVCGSPGKEYILDSMGSGAALFDADGDGDLDLFLVQGATRERAVGIDAPSDRLYRNDGGFRFTDVTEAAGVKDDAWGMGAAVGDVDDDGDFDLYVTNWGRNVLWRNDGGRFTDVTADAAVGCEGWSTSAGFADYDQDGDLDLFVAKYVHFDWARPPERGHSWKGVPSYVGPQGLTPEADVLYRNEGGGRFVDASVETGIAAVEPGFGLGVLWFDADEDGDDDLFVANDTTPSNLFINSVPAGGTFVDRGVFAGVALNGDGAAQASMGVACGDADGDGKNDLYVTSFAFDHDTLYRNLGGGLWDASAAKGDVRRASFYPMGWGVAFADVDADGDLDVAVASGHLYPAVDQSPLKDLCPYRERAGLYLNDGSGRFTDVSEHAGPGIATARCGRGLASGDLDGDGDVDFVITTMDERPALLENKSPQGHWLRVRLEQTGKNRFAIGATVEVTSGGKRQSREIGGGGSYLSHSDLRLHFGLGAATTADVAIRWPSGPSDTVEKHAGVAVDREVTFRRGEP